jgi:hypothetical protein
MRRLRVRSHRRVFGGAPLSVTLCDMKVPSHMFYHKSLTLSLVASMFAILATSFLPEHEYRMEHQASSYYFPALATALVGLAICIFTLLNLIRDNRSGYPSFRCSLATMLWALACVPIGFLGFLIISWFPLK